MRIIYIHASAPANIPTVVLHSLFNITSDTVNYNAEVTNDGGGAVTQRGIEVNEKNDFTGFYMSDYYLAGTGAGYWSGYFSPLEAGKVYYARAFAVNSAGVGYSSVVQFTTATTPTLAEVTLNSISGVTQTSALFDATVTGEGGATVTSRGVAFYSNPQCTGGSIGASVGSGTGNFNGIVNTFTQNTTYYARAYATNSYGTAVSNVIEFKTPSVATVPVVNGIAATPTGTVTSWNASSELVGNGGSAVSVSGIVACPVSMGTPTIDNYTHKTTNGPTTPAAISALLTGLTPSTSYNVRGYATNGVGNGYSATGTFAVTDDYQLLCEFQTNCPPTKVFSPKIEGSGLYKWDLGGGVMVEGKSVSHTYSNTGTKTVKLFGKNAEVYSIMFISIDVVGALNLSHTAFSSVSEWFIAYNPLFTGITIPSVLTSLIGHFNIHENSSLTGTLNLSVITQMQDGGQINVSNTKISLVLFASTVAGLLRRFYCNNSLIDNLDLSAFSFADNFEFLADHNPNLYRVLFKLNSAYCSRFEVHNNPLLKWVPLNLFPNLLNYNNAAFIMSYNAMTAAEVNKIYVHLNDSTSGTFTQREINIEKGNAVPDSSSGGYNGSGAKTTLASRGINIISY